MFKLFWYWSGVPRHWFALPDHQVWLFVPLWSGELCVFVFHEDIHQHHLLLHLELHHTRDSGSHSQRPGQKPYQLINKRMKVPESQTISALIEHVHWPFSWNYRLHIWLLSDYLLFTIFANTFTKIQHGRNTWTSGIGCYWKLDKIANNV